MLVGTVTTTYFLDSGLAASTPYSYQVRAVDAAGNRSTASNSLSQRTASQATSTKGTLAGVVFDSSGAGNRDAVATFTPSSGATKSDNANYKGVWSISNLNAGAGTLTISAPGPRDADVHRLGRRRQDGARLRDADLALQAGAGRAPAGPRSCGLGPLALATMRAGARNDEPRTNGRLG